jgi:hypothetical protein
MLRTVFRKSLSSVYCAESVADASVEIERHERDAMLKKCITIEGFGYILGNLEMLEMRTLEY